jgi:hypothetical protein
MGILPWARIRSRKAKISIDKAWVIPNISHNVTGIDMSPKRAFKILALILVFLLTGGMVPQAFAACDLPCCDSKGNHLNHKSAIPGKCDPADIHIKEIKNFSCRMSKAPGIEGMQGAYLTAFQAARPARGGQAVLFCDFGSPLSNLFEGPVRRPLNLAQAPPESLYLQNLTLLI